jgi:uncharacterized protein DUF2844
MDLRRRRDLLAVSGIAVILVVGSPAGARATLGGDVSSVDVDRIHVQGALLRINRTNEFTTHEIQSASGTVIREYVSSTGTVFGVAWQGPWLPNLQQILGPFFEQYQTAMRTAQASRHGHGPVVIDTPELVVQISGQPRAFSGNAYVPRLIPQGVRAETIR